VLRHAGAVVVHVDGLAPLLGELDRELEWESVGGSEREGVLAGDRILAGEIVEYLQAALERFPEALLFGLDDRLDPLRMLDHLGVPGPHLTDDDGRQPVDAVEADAPGLHDGASDQSPENVPTPLVTRDHSFRNQERHPATVVAEHAMCLRCNRRGAVLDARLLLDPVHDQPEPVGVEDRLGLLEQHRATLEPEPRVDVLLRKRRQRAALVEVVLHEHEVPELEETLAALAAGRAVGFAAAVLLAAVVVEFGARATRAGCAGRAPEVLRSRESDDPVARDALAQPAADSFFVLAETELGVTGEHGRPDPLGLELHLLGGELPGKIDGAILEVVAE